MHILIPSNIETGEQEINIIDDKYHAKDKFILDNIIDYVKRNQITDLLSRQTLLFWDSYIMAHGWIKTYFFYKKIIIALYLFKKMTEDPSGSTLSKQVEWMLQ